MDDLDAQKLRHQIDQEWRNLDHLHIGIATCRDMVVSGRASVDWYDRIKVLAAIDSISISKATDAVVNEYVSGAQAEAELSEARIAQWSEQLRNGGHNLRDGADIEPRVSAMLLSKIIEIDEATRAAALLLDRHISDEIGDEEVPPPEALLAIITANGIRRRSIERRLGEIVPQSEIGSSLE